MTDSTNPGEGRRFLIATAVAHYRHAPQWDRRGLIDARARIIELFTTTLGYHHVSDLGLDPTKDQLTMHLRAFCRSGERRPGDMLVVYVAGHGEVLDNGEHVLLTTDTDPEDVADALPTAELARKILLGTEVRRVLLMLDACYSGRGGNELAAAALTRMTQHWEHSPETGLVVLTSAQPTEQAQTGAFPRLLQAAVEGLPTAGHTPPVLPLDAVVQAMNTDPGKPGFQTISSTVAHLTGSIPPFLPNPRYNPRLTEVDVAIQQATEWDAQTQRRDVEFRTRLLVRAMGGQDASQGWWFAGRHVALMDIANWLRHPDPTRPLLAVTAAPGSGKTAVLGLIAALSHPERRASVPVHTLGLPAAAIPAVGAVDVVIYAQNLTSDQVLLAITAAVRSRAGTVGELLEQLASRTTPLTVLIDALDEAVDPDQLTHKLLSPLVEHGQGRLRLLVGTRPHLLANLGLHRNTSVDLDAPRYADLDALATYAARGLLDGAVNSAYPRQPPSVIRSVAHAVAAASDPSFLVARITSATLAADSSIPDPRDPDWQRELPRLPGQAMRRDLETRLGADAGKVRDLLRPLAYAEGQGLPWEDLWAPLASRIAGVSYTDDDLLWLRHHAGSYVIEAVEAGRSAYRLYHQALAEHLRDGCDDIAIQQAFTHVLRSRVPLTTDGSRDWTRAHPYTLRHLAAHATNAGLLDDLLTDTDYLVYAEPDELLLALHDATTEDGRLICSIYRASAALHRGLSPLRRRQVLATDAARFASTRHQRALSAPLRWPPRWATGQQTSTALHTTLTGQVDSVRAVACTVVDGTPVAVTAGSDRTVRVWDLTTGALHTTLIGHVDSVRAVACTVVDGTPVAVTAGSDRMVRVWNLITGALRTTLAGHEQSVNAVACTVMDGTPVAVTAGSDRTVRVWDLTTGAQHNAFTSDEHSVNAVDCSILGDTPIAVTGSDDGTMQVWDLTTGALRTTLAGHASWVNAVACTVVDGTQVALTGGHDHTVRVWDLTTGALRTTLAGHRDSVNAVACAVVGGIPVAVTGSDDQTVRMWDLTTGALHATFTGHADSVHAVACTVVDSTSVAVTASSDGTLRIWHLASTVSDHAPQVGHTADIVAVASILVEGQAVAVTGSDAVVRVWDLATGALRTSFVGHERSVNAVACTVVDGTPVAITGSDDLTVRVWDLTTGAVRVIFTGHKGSVNAVASAVVDGVPVAVTGSRGRTPRVWDLTTGAVRTSLVGHEKSVNAVACTVVDGTPVAVTGSNDRTVRIWDLTTGALHRTLTGHERSVNAVACAVVDGTPVAVTGSDDLTVRVWDLTTGVLRVIFTGHKDSVNAVACAVVDGISVAVTGSQDQTVRIWDLAANCELALFDQTGRSSGALCIGPAQEIVIGAGWDLVVIDRRPV